MVFQESMTSLNPVFTVGDQISEAIRQHQDLRGAAAKNAAIEMLDRVGIPEPAARYAEYPHQMSGGMKQLVLHTANSICVRNGQKNQKDFENRASISQQVSKL